MTTPDKSEKESELLKELEDILNINAFWSEKYDTLSNPDELAQLVLNWIKTKKADLFQDDPK